MEALQQYQKQKYDLFLLDINLPDGNGLEFCKKIRETSETPVLFLTANDTEEDMLEGFGVGCDDYISKPFSIEVLRKKVLAVLKRTGIGKFRMKYRDLELDKEKCVVLMKGQEIHLTSTEYKLLLYLMENRGRVVTKAMLLEQLWDIDGNFVDDNTVRVNIKRLRQKLHDEKQEYIVTVFGMGYKLILIIGTATAVVSVGVFFFMEDILFRTLFISFAFVFLCGLLFLMDFLHNRYNDNLLEEITLLIEALVEQQERMVFSEAEDTLTARLQHQLLKLRNILKAQNQMLTQEKEQIKTLISDISHQIKTPVAAANTFAQLLGDTGLSDEERSEYIATLQMSLEKLTFLTNSLIKMSRLESGIIRLKPEQNSLNDIVMQAVKTVYAKARDKNITITFDCGQTFEALLDFNWTAEAVTNVLDNAVKYTPSGGVVDLKITEYPSYLRLDVSDNGIGIPEEEQAKIFGRFYRGKQSAGVDGVGIGLYLTRDIVNKQNGYIKVASDEKGTTFSLFLKKFREQ